MLLELGSDGLRVGRKVAHEEEEKVSVGLGMGMSSAGMLQWQWHCSDLSLPHLPTALWRVHLKFHLLFSFLTGSHTIGQADVELTV